MVKQSMKKVGRYRTGLVKKHLFPFKRLSSSLCNCIAEPIFRPFITVRAKLHAKSHVCDRVAKGDPGKSLRDPDSKLYIQVIYMCGYTRRVSNFPFDQPDL
ncbi:hypothetical protein YC2023_095625 [Brassica napus]